MGQPFERKNVAIPYVPLVAHMGRDLVQLIVQGLVAHMGPDLVQLFVQGLDICQQDTG